MKNWFVKWIFLVVVALVYCSFSGFANIGNSANMPASCTIIDNDPLPSVDIPSGTTQEGPEGEAKQIAFKVVQSVASKKTTTVEYATVDGTAKAADGDYIANSGTLTFQPGVVEQEILITINGDAKYEIDESFSVVLSNPSQASIGTGTGECIIQNDDVMPIITVSNISVPEGDSGNTDATFQVMVSVPAGVDIAVDYATVDGTAIANQDYVPSSETLNIPAGSSGVPLSISIIGNTVYDGDRVFNVNFSNPVNAVFPGA